MDQTDLTIPLIVWMVAIAVLWLVRSRRGTHTAGLVLAYALSLWLIHWFATAMYVLPWFQHYDHEIVAVGLEQSTFAIVAFAIGSLAGPPLLERFGIVQRTRSMYEADERLPKAYLAIGILAYAALSTFGQSLPTVRALLASGQQLIVVGLALSCWQAWTQGDGGKLAFWVAATLLLPFVTVVAMGFLGYGTLAALTVLIFLSGFVRNRAAVVASALVLAYLGFSVYITYMHGRREIRDAVWSGQSLGTSVSTVENAFANFEWFDPTSDEQLQVIQERLNQNYLTGLAVERLSNGAVDYAKGETMWDAVLELVPRAIWSGKTVEAGSGDLVSRFTGLRFYGDTSVGIGQVMEFYVNFGTAGVLIGFIVVGTLVSLFDQAAAERLVRGDLHGFVLWYLPGLALLQVGGSLVDVSGSAAASVVVALAANQYLSRLQTRRTLAQPPVPDAPRF